MKDPLLRDCRYLNQLSSSIGNNNLMSRSTISTSESGQELWPVGVKLGIVRLGYSAGKLKYTLVDEQDIVLAREYTFEARLEVLNHNSNISGSGAVVFAYAYQTSTNNSSFMNNQMILLQDLIWRRHHGPIPERKRVVHRNHISMDNRLDNLCLLDLGSDDENVTTHVWYTVANQVYHYHHHHHHHFNHHHIHHYLQNNHHSHQNQQQLVIQSNNNQRSIFRGHHHGINNNRVEHNDDQQQQQQQQVMPVQNQHASVHSQQHFQPPKSSSNDLHLTLYWAAIQQLPPEHLQQQQQQQQSTSNNIIDTQAEINSASRCFDSQGNPLNDQESSTESTISYFECHYGPCVRIERCPREFSICGRCQETRYCGTTCQQLDWPYHKRYCRYKARRQLLTPYSYRSSSSSSSTTTTTTTNTNNSTLSSSYSPRQRSLR